MTLRMRLKRSGSRNMIGVSGWVGQENRENGVREEGGVKECKI